MLRNYLQGLSRQVKSSYREIKSNPSFLYKTPLANEHDSRKFSKTSKLCKSDEESKMKVEKLKLVKLMDMPFLIFPSPWKMFRSKYYEFVIKRNYGPSFSIRGIVKGTTQALVYISYYLSEGEFSELEKYIVPKALKEIKKNYAKLDERQKNFLLVDEQDLFRKFLYDLQVKKEKDTGKEFAEATLIFHGFRGFRDVDFDQINPLQDLHDNPENVFICNYKLVKELTKDLEKEWIIQELNHFHAAVIM